VKVDHRDRFGFRSIGEGRLDQVVSIQDVVQPSSIAWMEGWICRRTILLYAVEVRLRPGWRVSPMVDFGMPASPDRGSAFRSCRRLFSVEALRWNSFMK
jgi:hypothetical protein